MGQIPGTLRKYRTREERKDRLADFELFAQLPYEARSLIWEFAWSTPRIIEVDAIWGPTTAQTLYSTSTPFPTLLRVNQEARNIVLKRCTFHLSDRVKLFLNPAIDTLLFSNETSHFFVDFLEAVEEDDLKTLKNLAIAPQLLICWLPRFYRHNIFRMDRLMQGLGKFMVGITIVPEAGYTDLVEDFYFNGEPPTRKESMILTGTIPDLALATQSLHGKLFYFDNPACGFAHRYPGHIPIAPGLAGLAYHKIVRQYQSYSPGDLGVNRTDQGMIDYDDWRMRVWISLASTDFVVKRMLAWQRERSPEGPKRWAQLRVGCFAKPEGSSMTWKRCLQPLCDAEWPTRPEAFDLQ